jgi:hypothetical protein
VQSEVLHLVAGHPHSRAWLRPGTGLAYKQGLVQLGHPHVLWEAPVLAHALVQLVHIESHLSKDVNAPCELTAKQAIGEDM